MKINDFVIYACYLLIGTTMGCAGLGIGDWQFWVIGILAIIAVSAEQMK
jgi:hypothetical protein